MTDLMSEKGGQRETETGTNDMLGEQNLDTEDTADLSGEQNLDTEDTADLSGEQKLDTEDTADLSGEQRPDIDDIADLSEEDIDKLMNSAKNSAVEASEKDEERRKINESKDFTELDGIDSDSDTSDIARLLKASDSNTAADDSIDDLLKQAQEGEEDVSLTEDDVAANDKLDLDEMITKAEKANKPDLNSQIEDKDDNHGHNFLSKISGIFGGKNKKSVDIDMDVDEDDSKKASVEEKAGAKKAAAEKKAEAKKATAEKKAEAKKAAAEKKAEAKKAAAEKKAEAKKTAEAKESEIGSNDAGISEDINAGTNADDDIAAMIDEMNNASEGAEISDGEKNKTKSDPDRPALSDQDLMAAAEEVTHDDNKDYMSGAITIDDNAGDKENDSDLADSVEENGDTASTDGDDPELRTQGYLTKNQLVEIVRLSKQIQ